MAKNVKEVKGYRLCDYTEYQNRDGETKKSFHAIGKMTVFLYEDGGKSRIFEPYVKVILEPGKTYSMFKIEKKDKSNRSQQTQTEQKSGIEYPADDINPDNIPF